MSWTNVSNELDKRVQEAGQMCPRSWTNVSKKLDKRVQEAGQTCPECWTNVSNIANKEYDDRISLVGVIELAYFDTITHTL